MDAVSSKMETFEYGFNRSYLVFSNAYFNVVKISFILAPVEVNQL